MKPLILDFDGAVKTLPNELRIDLHNWQETLRFSCRNNALKRLENNIEDTLAVPHDTVFLGSGDYHHISHLLIRRYASKGQSLQVVVFDNHPDNMRYPFGLHCGSWVWHVSRLKFVSQIHVLGITSRDVEAMHGWENHLRNLRSGKVCYWCVGSNLNWMRSLGISHSHSFASADSLLDAFSGHLELCNDPIYLSIDKDVLSVDEARTNWDQGVMRLAEMKVAITALKNRIIGSDVTGEVSVYHYQSRLKRLLSGLDAQPRIVEADLQQWQSAQQAINLELLQVLAD